jgi:cytochrome P450
MNDLRDPFREQREDTGVAFMRAEGEDMPLVLRLRDIRKVCKDWQTYSSDDPFMIVPHSEADVRNVRQYPLETDPPDHPDYRTIIVPFFNRPNDAVYQAEMLAMVDDMIIDAISKETIEVVHEFALPLQSRALARLLNVDEAEANVWIGWGIHVFKDGDGITKGAQLNDYVGRKFVETADSAGDDMFSVLNRAEFRGRRLTEEEKYGYANLAFAGGRDTIIHSVSSIIAYLAGHPESLESLKANPALIATATEEFVRFVSPLTAIARKCPHGAELLSTEVPEGGRIGLCWPSANRDETVFDNPAEVVLERFPNPHVGFGFGIHRCLGAPQARLVIRNLLESICKNVESLRLIDEEPEIEVESSFTRQVGYKTLNVAFKGMAIG